MHVTRLLDRSHAPLASLPLLKLEVLLDCCSGCCGRCAGWARLDTVRWDLPNEAGGARLALRRAGALIHQHSSHSCCCCSLGLCCTPSAVGHPLDRAIPSHPPLAAPSHSCPTPTICEPATPRPLVLVLARLLSPSGLDDGPPLTEKDQHGPVLPTRPSPAAHLRPAPFLATALHLDHRLLGQEVPFLDG